MHPWLVTLVLTGVLAISHSAGARPLGLSPSRGVFVAMDAEMQADTQADRHAVRGVVKDLTDNSLTIARASRKANRLTFILNASTTRSGTITIGSLVSVRYRVNGDTRVATAVTAREDIQSVR